MSLHVALRNHLKAFPGVAAIVGERVYPQRRPQNSPLPAITYFRVSSPKVNSHDGYSGLSSPRYQLDCWAERYDDARALAEVVVLAMANFRGWRSGVDVQASLLEDDRDDLDPDEGEHRVMVDVIIWAKEAA